MHDKLFLEQRYYGCALYFHLTFLYPNVISYSYHLYVRIIELRHDLINFLLNNS